MTEESEGRWLLHFPNGTTAEMVETGRTPVYVQLQNSDNKNVLRLFAGHGSIQKSGAGPFRRFTEGNWVASQPSAADDTDYKIRVVYFVPSDREPTRNYEGKIQVILELIAQIMTGDLKSKGYETDGPPFFKRDGKIVVDLLRGEKKSLEYNQGAAWRSSAHGGAIFDEVDRRHGSTKKPNDSRVFRNVRIRTIATSLARAYGAGCGTTAKRRSGRFQRLDSA